MGKSEFLKSKWIIISALVSFVYGLPGMVDDLTAWKLWISKMSPVWSGFFVGAGTAGIILWLIETSYPPLKKKYTLVKNKKKFMALHTKLTALRNDYAAIDTKGSGEVSIMESRFAELQFLLMGIGLPSCRPPSSPDKANWEKRLYLEWMTLRAEDGNIKLAMTYPGK